MKITKQQLRRIIREAKYQILNENVENEITFKVKWYLRRVIRDAVSEYVERPITVNAAGECVFEVFYGDIKVGEFRNTITGDNYLFNSDDIQPIASRLTCRAGEAIRVVLRSNASATDKLKVWFNIHYAHQV